MECFAVYADELEGRIDPNPYHPIRRNTIKKLKNSEFQLFFLKDVVEFKKQIVTSKSDDLIYIGLENIESNTGVYIPSEEEKEEFGTAFKFEKGDILFPKLRPYLNKVHLAEFDGVCSTEFYVLNSNKCDNVYLFSFLNSPIVVNQTSYLMTGNTLPRLQTEEVENLIIPIPSILIQNKIIEITKKLKDIRKKKEIEAIEILESINDYVLEELGIKLPELKDRMTYIVNSEEVNNNRINAYYYQPKFDEVENAINKGKFEEKELKDIIKSLINGFDYREFTDSGVIYLRVSNIRPHRFNLLDVKFIPDMKISKDIKLKQGDVLLTRKGTFGISTVVDKDSEKYLISSEIFRMVLKEGINPHYLSTWLNSKPQQIIFDRIKTGGIMGHLSQEVLLQIKIPMPPLAIQNKIVEEFKSRMQKAEQLQKEAKDELEKAKQEVERIILGG